MKENKKEAVIIARVPTDLKRKMKDRADAAGRNLSEESRIAFEKYLKK